MLQAAVKLLIPFDALVQSITELDIDKKRRLWELLEEELAQAEEEHWEQDPVVRAEIREARAAYEAGDYVTLEEYIAQSEGLSS